MCIYIVILATLAPRSKRNPVRQATQPPEASSSLLQVPPRASSGPATRRSTKPPSSGAKPSSGKNKKRDRGETLESSGEFSISFQL